MIVLRILRTAADVVSQTLALHLEVTAAGLSQAAALVRGELPVPLSSDLPVLQRRCRKLPGAPLRRTNCKVAISRHATTPRLAFCSS